MASGDGGTGGGAGGGKIPTRRCHLRSFQPYQLGRQRHQGILSRFTESIKNIVPRWLQSYFSRNEDVCTCSTDRREAQQGPENREDDHLICADEESANIHDGRITPEPTVSNTEDTATTTTSNCPHVVTRPSLHRSHLNFSISDSLSLNSEPSTSWFPTSSSRVSLVKEMKDSASQHDNAASENTSVPHRWSMETKTHSFSRHTATSSKNPAFFRRLSQSSGRASTLQTSQHGISCFHPVKTRYGGATAFLREPKVRNTPYQSVSPASAKLYQDDVTSTSPGLVAYMDELALQLDGQHSHH